MSNVVRLHLSASARSRLKQRREVGTQGCGRNTGLLDDARQQIAVDFAHAVFPAPDGRCRDADQISERGAAHGRDVAVAEGAEGVSGHANDLPPRKVISQAKLSMTDKDSLAYQSYDVSMPERIGPKEPRQRAYLREWRKSRGWTQAHLAALVETTEATISRYETGSRDYPGGYLARIAEVFGVREADLYRLPDSIEPPRPPSLDSMLRDAPPAIRQAAREIVEALLKASAEPTKKTGT